MRGRPAELLCSSRSRSSRGCQGHPEKDQARHMLGKVHIAVSDYSFWGVSTSRLRREWLIPEYLGSRIQPDKRRSARAQGARRPHHHGHLLCLLLRHAKTTLPTQWSHLTARGQKEASMRKRVLIATLLPRSLQQLRLQASST